MADDGENFRDTLLRAFDLVAKVGDPYAGFAVIKRWEGERVYVAHGWGQNVKREWIDRAETAGTSIPEAAAALGMSVRAAYRSRRR